MGDFERKRDRDDQPQVEGASPKRMRRVLADSRMVMMPMRMTSSWKRLRSSSRGDLENEGDDKPRVVSEDEMKKMDDEAEKEEEKRLIKMGVLHKVLKMSQ